MPFMFVNEKCEKLYEEAGVYVHHMIEPQKPQDAGIDLVACSVSYDKGVTGALLKVGFGIKVDIASHSLLMMRSSTYKNFGIRLSNCVGLIDMGYRGEICGSFIVDYKDLDPEELIGRRIAQLVPTNSLANGWHLSIPVGEVTPSERGEGGFGSTGV